MHTIKRAVPTVPASDISRARRFYEEKLGFRVVDEGPDGGCLFEVGDTYIYVYPTEAPRGGNTAFELEAEDFDHDFQELRDKGIVFENYDMPNLKTIDGIAEYEGMRSAWFKDSEGNIIALGEMMAMRKAKAA